MGQRTSSIASAPEERMQKRIQQAIGTFVDFGEHVAQANQWARLCPTPKTCYLSFRMVISDRVSIEMLPYVWRIPGNVQVEVRKLRRLPEMAPRGLVACRWTSLRFSGEHDGPEEVIRPPKILSLCQFYYIYCFLSDIKSCAVHTVNFPDRETKSHSGDEDPEFDETECQICMDKQKQVALPCSHSFCLSCFQRWNSQSDSCPICRSKIECSEGSSLWQLTSLEVTDIGSYATDLVARIFEFLDQRDSSTYSEDEIRRSMETYAEASAQKSAGIFNISQADMLPTILPLGLSALLGSSTRLPTEVDSDFVLALQLAAGEDQFAALRQYEQLQRDQTLANWMAMQLPRDDEVQDASGAAVTANDEPLP